MYEVVLRRINGRLVKTSRPLRSKYQAKQLTKKWEAKYDTGYYVEIRPV